MPSNFQADKLLQERRLDEIERLWLANPSKAAIVEHLQGYLPDPNCQDPICLELPREQRAKSCRHGPPRWPGKDPAKPISLRMIEYYLAAMHRRMRVRLAEGREQHRAEAAARLRDIVRRALGSGALREALVAQRLLAELDGSFVAAEEAAQPTLYQRVLSLMASVVDYEPPAPGAAPPPPIPPERARFELLRLEHLLSQADDSAARFRVLGDPAGRSEIERREFRRNLLDEAAWQAATAPGLSPERRRDAIGRLAGAAALVTEDAEIAELADRVVKKLRETGAT